MIKKEKFKKKLALHKSTVCCLSPLETNNIRGGIGDEDLLTKSGISCLPHCTGSDLC